MKSLSRRLASSVRSGKVALVASVFAWLTIPNIHGATYTLTDGNSVVGLDLGTPAGMNSWVVDGLNQVQQQFVWYRLGSAGPESPLTAITTSPTVTQANTRQLSALYADNRLGVQLTYLLSGGTAGSGRSGYSGTIRVYNYSDSPFDFHVFQYSHLTMGGQVQIGLDGSLYNNVVQTSGLGSFTSFITPSANGAEAAPFNATWVKLNDASASSLSGATTAVGDPTWALQWDFTIPGKSSVVISTVNTLVVPEPASLTLIGLGIGAWLLRRRK